MTKGDRDIPLPAAEEIIMSVPNLVGHGPMTFGSAWIGLIDIKGALIRRLLALAKAVRRA
jgi:hypothetical protein